VKRVALLLPGGVEILEAAAFFDVLGWASLEGSEAIEVVTVGLDREVVSTFGMRLLPDALIDDIDPSTFDALAVPGGFEEYGYYEQVFSQPVDDLIRAFDRRDKPIASICVGALPLAHAGVLEGRRATTYHLGDGRRRRQLAGYGCEVVDAAVVRDGRVLTSTAPSSAVEVALALLELLTDHDNAARVRALMGFDGG
jgi:protein deglycase